MAVQLLYNSSYDTYLQGNDSIQALQLYREALRDQRTVWQKVIDFLGNLFGYEPSWVAHPSEKLQALYNVLYKENQTPQSVINGILKLCENADQKNKVMGILYFCKVQDSYVLACCDGKRGFYKYDFCRFSEESMPKDWKKDASGHADPLYPNGQCIINAVAACDGSAGLEEG